MVKLATELLSEQISPVRILSLSDRDGEPQGEFVSNQQRYVFKFTKAGLLTYQPTGGQRDRADSRMRDFRRRLARIKTLLRELQ